MRVALGDNRGDASMYHLLPSTLVTGLWRHNGKLTRLCLAISTNSSEALHMHIHICIIRSGDALAATRGRRERGGRTQERDGKLASGIIIGDTTWTCFC